jgi:hypothetical protein
MSAGAQKPRKARARRVRKPRVSSGPRIPASVLTSRDVCQYVYDVSNAKLGAIIKTTAGHVAWTLKEKIGAFATAAEAERAVHGARDKPKPASKPKPWETR